MKLIGLLLKFIAFTAVSAHGKPNVYAQEKIGGARQVGAGGGGGGLRGERGQAARNVAGTFQANSAAGAGVAAVKPVQAIGNAIRGHQQRAQAVQGAAVRGQQVMGYRGFMASTATPTPTATIAAAAVNWPWSNAGGGAGGGSTGTEQPHVLVATVLTTITKYSVLMSTVTANYLEIRTETTTETETMTRHSTRTIQVVSTQISKFTLTKTTTETDTTTEYSLVPFTITEVETMTETYENVILTTYTIPASTILKTVWSTSTLPAATVKMTEYLQPLIETVSTETIFRTETRTEQPTTILTTIISTIITNEVLPSDGFKLIPQVHQRIVEESASATIEEPSEPQPISESAELQSENLALTQSNSEEGAAPEPFETEEEPERSWTENPTDYDGVEGGWLSELPEGLEPFEGEGEISSGWVTQSIDQEEDDPTMATPLPRPAAPFAFPGMNLNPANNRIY